MRKNNKGYSFVELIITMAIFSIIMLAIILMMRTSLVSYKDGLFETTMQEEAQIVANQVSDLLIDATYINSYDSTPNAEEYSFKGPEGSFTIKHVVEVDGDGNFVNGKLVYSDASGIEQLLSDQMKTFYISGLNKRTTSDKAVYDNAATVNVEVLYQERGYTASKDVYFRNNIENFLLEETNDPEINYDPYSVDGAPDSISGGGGNPNQETEKICRYHVTDMSAKYDIIADAVLYENDTAISWSGDISNGSYFMLKRLNNDMITNPPTGLDVKRYTVEVSATALSNLGTNTPAGSPKYYLEGKDSKGATKKVLLQLEPVVIGPDNATRTGTYVSKSNGGEITDTGSPTHIQVKGINLNDAVQKGVSVTYNAKFVNESGEKDTYSNREVKYNGNNKAYVKEIKPKEGKPSDGDGPDDGTGFPFKIAPDPVDGGLEISTGNGMGNNKDSYKYLWEGGHKNDLKITFKINGTAQPEITYHFIFTGMSLEPYN